MYLNILLFIVFISVFASLFTQGLWSNTITLVNVITAALIATNYYEPVANLLDKQEPSLTYIWDLSAIWLLFGLTMVGLRAATDYMSQLKVRFFLPVEKAGGIVMAIWVSWIAMCFTTMTLHTAPLAKHFLGGGFQPEPTAKMFFGLAPDHVWLAWVHKESSGALSRFQGPAPFDAEGDFIFRHANRRAEFDAQLTLTKGGTGKSLPGSIDTPAQ
jgi:Colicin V production protein